MRLLLDAHLSPNIARKLAAEGYDAVALQDWRGGEYRHATDADILAGAQTDQRVWVTYDVRVQVLAREWAETGRHQAGLVLISRKTIRQSDIGALVSALRQLLDRASEQPWTDRVVFLTDK